MKTMPNAMSVQATGVNVTTTISTSAGGAIPNAAGGQAPKYVRFASTGTCYVRLRSAATTAVVRVTGSIIGQNFDRSDLPSSSSVETAPPTFSPVDGSTRRTRSFADANSTESCPSHSKKAII
jgi:hypothetical protein